jgi:hypothetical protein
MQNTHTKPNTYNTGFSTFPMLWSFNTVLHVVVNPNHKIILLLLYNCNFAVMNRNVNIWYVQCLIYRDRPQVENHWLQTNKQHNDLLNSFFFFFHFFFETGFLCVALAVLKLRNPPASAFRVLGLKACATTARLAYQILYQNFQSFLYWDFPVFVV